MSGRKRLRQCLIAAAAAVVAAVAASPAQAQWTSEPPVCDVFSPEERPPTTVHPIERLQGGIRSFFDAGELERAIDYDPRRPRLRDGRWGTTTAAGMNLLCDAVPLAVADDAKRTAYLDLAAHYNDIAFAPNGEAMAEGERWPNWREIVTEPAFADFLDADDPTRRERRRLRLAGSAAMMVALLDGYGGTDRRGSGVACATLTAGAELGEPQRDLLAALGFGLRTDADRPSDQLAAFCRAFPVRVLRPDATLRSTALAALDHLAFVQAEVPNAIEILKSDAFADWVRDADASALSSQRLRRLAGSHPAVVALLRDFLDNSPVSVTAAAPPACRPPEGWRYYELRERDLETLAGRSEHVAAVEALRGETYGSREALRSAVASVLGAAGGEGQGERDGTGLDACSAALLDRAVERLPGAAIYTLTPEAIDNLKATLPAAAPELGGVFEVAPGGDPERMARRLQDRLVAALAERRRTRTEALVETLLQLAEPAAAVADTQAQADQRDTEGGNAAANSGEGGADDADATPEDGGEEVGQDGDAATEDGDDTATAPVAEKLIVLTPQSLDVLEDAGLPPGVLKEVAGEPLTPQALRRRATTLLLQAFDEQDAQFATVDYRKRIESALQEQVRVQADDTFVDGLVSALPALQSVRATTGERVADIAEVAFPEETLLRAAAVHPLAGADHTAPLPEADLTTLVEVARRTPDEAGQAFPAAVGDCGCRQRLDSVVYGFYPFWTPSPAADPPSDVSRLDLSRLSDVAFIGLRLAPLADGLRVDDAAWRAAGSAADFVTTARRHGVNADLAVDLVGWREWNAEQRAAAAAAVATAAAVPERDPFAWRDLLSVRVFDRWLSHELDGVTLRFNGLADLTSDDLDDAVGRIVDIVTAVRRAGTDNARLDEQLDVNIAFALPGRTLDSGARRELVARVFERLGGILATGAAARRGGRPDVRLGGLVLVSLDRPTAMTKTILHDSLRAAFDGLDRRSVLRQTVPVVAGSGHGGRDALGAEAATGDNAVVRLQHDLIYFEDNFGGTGFWPVPLADDPGYRSVVGAIDANLVTQRIDDRMASWAAAVPAICGVICPNRILFRTVLVGLLLGFVTIVVLARLWCRFCTDVAERFFLPQTTGLVLLSAGAVITVCDPWLRDQAAWIAFAAGVTLFAVIFRQQAARLGRQDQP